MHPHRLRPQLPAQAMKTYQVVRPPGTHWRPASCAEVDCPNYLNGWQTLIDESSELGQRQAHYIRSESGRRFTEHRDGPRTVFEFEAGQTCFAQHQTPVDRPELYVVRDGDWRGNPRGTQPRFHTRGEDWVEDFAEHQTRLAELLERS